MYPKRTPPRPTIAERVGLYFSDGVGCGLQMGRGTSEALNGHVRRQPSDKVEVWGRRVAFAKGDQYGEDPAMAMNVFFRVQTPTNRAQPVCNALHWLRSMIPNALGARCQQRKRVRSGQHEGQPVGKWHLESKLLFLRPCRGMAAGVYCNLLDRVVCFPGTLFLASAKTRILIAFSWL